MYAWEVVLVCVDGGSLLEARIRVVGQSERGVGVETFENGERATFLVLTYAVWGRCVETKTYSKFDMDRGGAPRMTAPHRKWRLAVMPAGMQGPPIAILARGDAVGSL